MHSMSGIWNVCLVWRLPPRKILDIFREGAEAIAFVCREAVRGATKLKDGIGGKRNLREAFRKFGRHREVATKKQPRNWESAISTGADAREIL